MTLRIAISCCLCDQEFKAECEPPPGWEYEYAEVGNDKGFCPKHAAVLDFVNSQCPGCVGGWMDCPLWQAFAYTHSQDIDAEDFAKIETGICPRRVNGTMSVGARGIEDLDLSERAPVESGIALAQAIRDYCERYKVEA
jgi:hypothetical protein